ncbi:MAG TPA: response regulator [Longimicrobium sp.]|nr:response regulator [Longimicrobium sp.]
MDARTVLIVEDDDASVDIFSTILRHGGYEVLSARTAAEGAAVAREHVPHLVVVDIGLPDAPGFGLLDELTDDPITAHIPLIVCTVHVFEHDERRARRAGGDMFLRKPIEPSELLRCVQKLLASPPAATPVEELSS